MVLRNETRRASRNHKHAPSRKGRKEKGGARGVKKEELKTDLETIERRCAYTVETNERRRKGMHGQSCDEEVCRLLSKINITRLKHKETNGIRKSCYTWSRTYSFLALCREKAWTILSCRGMQYDVQSFPDTSTNVGHFLSRSRQLPNFKTNSNYFGYWLIQHNFSVLEAHY